ncbi:MAG: hypothetical protein JSS32_10140 [Verrucomicrobia bacterium]|nr:hypothetical protein [Verrucomicrobiota bacterium]
MSARVTSQHQQIMQLQALYKDHSESKSDSERALIDAEIIRLSDKIRKEAQWQANISYPHAHLQFKKNGPPCAGQSHTQMIDSPYPKTEICFKRRPVYNC